MSKTTRKELDEHLKAVIFLAERAKDMAEFYLLQCKPPEELLDAIKQDCKCIINPIYDLMCEVDLIGNDDDDITWIEELRFKEEDK